MKKFAIAILCLTVVILWQPGQQSTGQKPSEVKEKDEQKLDLFRKVIVAQDSTLKLLNKPVEKKRNSRPAKKSIDTLTVKGNTIISPVDTLYEDLYFVIPDTTQKKKRTLFQRLFGWKNS